MLVSRPTALESNNLEANSQSHNAQPGSTSETTSGQNGSSLKEPSLKEKLAQKRKAARFRKEVTNFVVFSLFFAILVGSPLAILGGPKLAVGAVVAILCLAFAFKYPRQALWLFLIYLPFGGTITYAVGNSPLLQLALLHPSSLVEEQTNTSLQLFNSLILLLSVVVVLTPLPLMAVFSTSATSMATPITI